MSLVGRKAHGQVLKLDFVGPCFNHLLRRQLLVLAPGGYRLIGGWPSIAPRSEKGLDWALRCEHDQRELARLASMGNSGREWTQRSGAA